MKIVCLLILAVGLSGCSRVRDAMRPCSDDYETAALDVLGRKMRGMNEVSQYTSRYSQKDIDDERAKISALRKWADAQPDSCVRSAYIGWLDYYSDGVNKAENELKHGREQKEMDAYNSEIDARYKRARALNIPKP